MFWLKLVIVIAGIIIIYLLLPGGRLWKSYLKDVNTSFSSSAVSGEPGEFFTEERISKLPELLQKHIINGDYLNKPVMSNMRIHFLNTQFRMSKDKDPIKIDYQQINFAMHPDRHAFLAGRLMGLPIQVKDTVLDGTGSMTIVIAKLFQISESVGDEMDQAQLITALADAVFMPSLFLQDYVSWSVMNENTLEATITWNGISAARQFTFDSNGDITRFDTDDRYMEEKSEMIPTPWYVSYENYEYKNGYRHPRSVKVNWRLSEGDYTYFASDEIEVAYSIKSMSVTDNQDGSFRH